MKACSEPVFLLLLFTALSSGPYAPCQETQSGGEAPRKEEDPLVKASRAFEDQKLDEALEHAKKAEEEHPEKQEVFMLLGKIYLAQAAGIERYTGFAGYFRRDLLGEAEEYFRRVLKMDSGHAMARNHLAFTLLLLKNVPAARDQAEEVLRSHPDDTYAHYLIGEIQLLLEDAAGAESSFRASLGSDPASAEARAGLIRAFTEQGKREEARDNLVGLLKERPGLPGALSLAYDIYEPYDLLEDAAALYEAILAIAPGRLDTRFQLSSVYYRLGRFEQSGRAFDRVLAADPEHEGALYYKGCLMIKNGDWKAARMLLERSARREGDYFSYALDQMHMIALRLADDGEWDRAFECFDALLDINPSDSMALSNKALALSKAGRSDDAETAYRELLEREPWDSSYVNNYALHLLGKGKTSEGLAMLAKAVEIDGNLDAVENLGAFYYYGEGNLEKAERYLKQVLGSAPDRTKSLVLYEFIKTRRDSGHD
jgi:tetratricopeptide (TPR) repeat protein